MHGVSARATTRTSTRTKLPVLDLIKMHSSFKTKPQMAMSKRRWLSTSFSPYRKTIHERERPVVNYCRFTAVCVPVFVQAAESLFTRFYLLSLLLSPFFSFLFFFTAVTRCFRCSYLQSSVLSFSLFCLYLLHQHTHILAYSSSRRSILLGG